MLDVVSAAWRLDCALLQHRRQTASHATDSTTSQPTRWDKIRFDCSTPSLTAQNNITVPYCMSCNYLIRGGGGGESQVVKLPQLSCIAFRVLAEGLVWSRASGHRTRWGSGKCGWWSLGDLLSKVADPFLLLILSQGQQEHVPGRGHIVVYCKEW